MKTPELLEHIFRRIRDWFAAPILPPPFADAGPEMAAGLRLHAREIREYVRARAEERGGAA
jgi:hypothetical protein